LTEQAKSEWRVSVSIERLDEEYPERVWIEEDIQRVRVDCYPDKQFLKAAMDIIYRQYVARQEEVSTGD
jgi:methylphosphotriester-DNA--protein-cysteine methyltransferase